MKIVLLYAEVMGYTLANVTKLGQIGIGTHLVNWDKKRNSL